MSTPEPPSGPPAEAGGPDAPEPGHRARALAASLLGELTGQRRSGLTFAPLEPSGLAVTPRNDSPPAPASPASPADPDAPAPTSGQDEGQDEGPAAPAPVPTVEPEAPRLTVAPAPTEDRAPESTRDDAAEPSDDEQDPAPTAVAEAGPRVAAEAAPSAAAPRPPEVPPSVPGPVPGPVPGLVPGPVPAPPVAPAAPQPAAATRPAAPATPPTAAPAPSAAAALAPSAAAAAPSRTAQPGAGGAPSQDVRPAPFTYLAVAQHHTTPARATAHGALDQAGQRISSRVERALVRRAAMVTMEAASLLDACDVLDGRARAADATWNGDHHSPTEVREFEGAWGAFYDAQGALAQHVSG